MGIGISGPDVFVREPSEARFLCDVLADCASHGKYNRRQAYQALRALSPHELYDMYGIWRTSGNDAFRQAFGPVYHRTAGEEEAGPLFEGGDDE